MDASSAGRRAGLESNGSDPDAAKQRLEEEIANLLAQVEHKRQLLDQLNGAVPVPPASKALAIDGLQDGSDSSDSTPGSTMQQTAPGETASPLLLAGAGDVPSPASSVTRFDDETVRHSAVQPLKSQRASSVMEFKTSIEFGKKHMMINFDIRVTFLEFVLKVLDSTFVNLTEDDIRRMLHYIDTEGDVIKVASEQVFEEMKSNYLASKPWQELRPLRIVLVQDDMDPLSLVLIPPHQVLET
jgi:hypothetical protein